MIKVESVVKQKSKVTLVDQISFTVAAGEIIGLIGPNGAGKSTLLKLLAGVELPTKGSIIIQGSEDKGQAQIGYVPQEIALYERLTVYDNLKFWGEMAGMHVSRDQLRTIAEQVQLGNQLKKKVHALSGGMQRKLNIAAALIHNPDIILMDEPTVGIDIIAKQEIIAFLKELQQQGKTIIYTSHDIAEIEYLCDKVIYIERGKIKKQGKPEDIASLFGV